MWKKETSQNTSLSLHPYCNDLQADIPPLSVLMGCAGVNSLQRQSNNTNTNTNTTTNNINNNNNNNNNTSSCAHGVSLPWWWRRVDDGPTLLSVPHSFSRPAPSPLLRTAYVSSSCTSLVVPNNSYDSCDHYYYYSNKDTTNSNAGAQPRCGLSCQGHGSYGGGVPHGVHEGKQHAAAWYQLNYGVPVTTCTTTTTTNNNNNVSMEQPYNIQPSFDAAAAVPTRRKSPERDVSYFVVRRGVKSGDDGDSGVCDELARLRRRPDVVEATCTPTAPNENKQMTEITPPTTTTSKGGVGKLNISSCPSRLSSIASTLAEMKSTPPPQKEKKEDTDESIEETAAPGTSVETNSGRTPLTPLLTPERASGITLERLMNAVRRARERAKEQGFRPSGADPQSSDPAGAHNSTSVFRTSRDTSSQRVPPTP